MSFPKEEKPYFYLETNVINNLSARENICIFLAVGFYSFILTCFWQMRLFFSIDIIYFVTSL